MKNPVLGYILLFILAFSTQSAISQDNKVEDLRNQANAMRKEIEQKEAILLSSEKDINSKLNNLKIITAKIEEYEKLEKQLKKEIKALDKKIESTDNEIKEIKGEIEIKNNDVEKSRAEYAEALRKSRKYSKFENKLLFIFSAEDFSTMARRYRYANNYMDAHKALADSLKKDIAELQNKEYELQAKKDELNKTKESKEDVKKEQEAERAKIQKLEKEQKSIIASPEKEKSKVETELKKKRNELNKLNETIKREVEKVIAAETKKEEDSKPKTSDKKDKKTKDTSSYKEDAGIGKMTGSFENNKKKMPVPITGAYLLVDQFGERNAVGTKGSVMINNGGLTFKGTKGAQARAVFDGTVSTVFYHNDYVCVLVRHGKYISVYCNLENIKVKSGEEIKSGAIIGDVAIDAEDGNPSILFQLYREKTLLNPAEWLKL